VSLLPPPPGSDPGTGPIPATSPPPLGAMPFAPPAAGAIPAPGAPDPATGPVPMAMPYGPADATTPRWTADSNLAKLTIPYLGPEPRPSVAVRRVFLLACVVDVIIYLAKAWLYLHQAGMERDFLRHPTRGSRSPNHRLGRFAGWHKRRTPRQPTTRLRTNSADRKPFPRPNKMAKRLTRTLFVLRAASDSFNAARVMRFTGRARPSSRTS